MTTAELTARVIEIVSANQMREYATMESAARFRGKVRDTWREIKPHYEMLGQQRKQFARMAQDAETDQEWELYDTVAQFYSRAQSPIGKHMKNFEGMYHSA